MAKRKHDEDDDDDRDSGTNTAVMDALEELDDEEWNDTEEGFDDLPVGTYQVKIAKAAVVLSKSKGKLQIAWEFEVVSPAKYKGRKVFKYRGLVDEEDRRWAKTELAKLGVDWPKKKKLPKKLAELEETYAEIKLVESGGDSPYKNIVKAIDEDDVKESDDDEEDERPVKKRKGKKRDDEDEDEDEDDEEEKPRKKKSKKSKEDDEEDEEDEDDDDDEPKKKKKGKKVKDDDEDEEDEEEDEDDDKPKKKSKSDDDDAEVTCKFDADDFDDKQLKALKRAAKAAGIDANDYDDMLDLAGDVAEEVGVSGTFKSPAKLLAAIDDA